VRHRKRRLETFKIVAFDRFRSANQQQQTTTTTPHINKTDSRRRIFIIYLTSTH